jgi:hypothetical protein
MVVKQQVPQPRSLNPRAAAAMVGDSGVDDLQAEAVVDQLLHRHRSDRRERQP